ncbi:MAG: diguanylate cyclase response regulator [Gammaproteobacteria bacterium HGW-Gammaproteobacteria-3]|nr:MAG: diguanylate cyclase response regulator [Gammaproteobacteria bacterium HGW-Gammaproteobacteria-3]
MDTHFNFYELKALDRLPSPSGTALAIMRLVQSSETSAAQIAHLVQTDPALTGRILRFANSAALGARRPIVNVADAVAMIGMSAVRNFALSLSLINTQTQNHCRNFDYAAFWADSLLLAVTCTAITARERAVPPEEAFTLGLLADIGRLALATAWPEDYSQCLQEAGNQPLKSLERNQFAIDHDALTLLLLDDWGLPSVFLDALKLSTTSNINQTTRTGRCARQLVFARQFRRYCLTEDREGLLPSLALESENHGFQIDTLTAFADDILTQWHDWGELLDIKTPRQAPQDTHKKPPAKTTQSHCHTLDIMLIEDDSTLPEELSAQLSASGHTVTTCMDGESALRQALSHPPQLIVIDWQMHGMERLTFCHTLRAFAQGKSIYLIMLTDDTREDSLIDAFAAGVDDYVIKPVSIRVLLARISAGQRITALHQDLRREHQAGEQAAAALAKANRKLRQMAHTDVLTGLPNRRYGLLRLEKEWTASLRSRQPLSLFLLDLDYFKAINDSLGHDTGDDVLIYFANTLQASIRSGDVACRLGGEEFFVIAPNTDKAQALLLAERIRNAVEIHQPEQWQLPRPLTVSIGGTASQHGKPDWRKLMSLADEALYAVKNGSRNGVKIV